MTIKEQLMKAGMLWNRRRLKVSELFSVIDDLSANRKTGLVEVMTLPVARQDCADACDIYLGGQPTQNRPLNKGILGMDWFILHRDLKAEVRLVVSNGYGIPGELMLIHWPDVFVSGDKALLANPMLSAAFVGVKQFLPE